MIRALIVDDERPARDRMRHLLAGLPVAITGEAADGEEAVARAAALAPDVVFLDIQMPGLSGLEAAARLQAPRPRVVFCTAFDRFALEAFEHHALDYLLKPVNRERLARVVGRLVEETERERHRQRERADAIGVQAALLPAMPALDGAECAARAVPAGSVGGDYYDILAMGGGRTAFALGDVSGKGMYAGILAAAVQGRLQSMSATGAREPAAMLTELNRLTAAGLEPHRFVTLALAVHDLAASALTYAAAGHPPAILLSRGGAVRRLDATGPVLGWPDAAYTADTLPVGAGDLLALYSDGLTEATAPDGSELGVAGLIGILQAHRTRPIEGLLAMVLEEVDSFTGGAPPDDDRTLLLLRIS
jgi:serine phosphatase RsbU (regulator of sigma subunit)